MAVQIDNGAMRHAMELFAGGSFRELEGVSIDWAPCHFLLLSKLEQARKGEVKRLIITLPPRVLKSFFTSVVLPALILGHDPTADIMCVSYGKSLADKLAADRKRLMTSTFYTDLFGQILKGNSAQAALRTVKGGVCYGLSVESGLTGKGADFIILDDPQKAQDLRSEPARAKVMDTFKNALMTRLNNPQTGCVIIVMQRLHEDDLVGQVLQLEGETWDVLSLPAIAEQDEEYEIRLASGTKMFRRKEGDLLHASRLTREYLEHLKRTTPLLYATQYQQRPAPADGAFVLGKWFRRYAKEDLPDQFDEIVQSWDTANTLSQWADWTVCTTWGRVGQNLYLLHVHREKLIFPDLVRCVLRLAARFQPDLVLVEDHASGTQLLQVLKDQGFGRMRAIKPACDKETRIINQTAVIEAGFVWLPQDATWVDTYLHELVVFPNGRNDDQVDSTSQALEYFTRWDDSKGLAVWMQQQAAIARGEAPAGSAPAGASVGAAFPQWRVSEPPPDNRERWCLMRSPEGNPNLAIETTRGVFHARADGTCWFPGEYRKSALRSGWTLIADHDPAKPV